jgi:uncharacterized protein YegL
LQILIYGTAIGRTPTGKKLKEILGKIMKTLDDAIGKDYYRKIKPFDIIVLTDGEPSTSLSLHLQDCSDELCIADDPLQVLEEAAARLKKKKHHQNAVGVQFLQIGNEDGATDALNKLVRGNVRVSFLRLSSCCPEV